MLDEASLERWRDEGYLHLPGLLDAAMVERLRRGIDELLDIAAAAQREEDNHAWRGGDGDRGVDATAGGQLVVRAWHNLEHRHAAFLQAITWPPLVEALVDVIGPDVALHHSKLLYKPPSAGAPFPMHQDHPYFPHERHTMLAAMLHLDDADEQNGCLHVVPGSHRELLAHEGAHQLADDEWPLERGTAIEASAGDVVLFDYRTVHGSGPNRSERPRRNVLLQFRAADDRPTLLEHVDWGSGLLVAGRQPRFDDAVPEYEVEAYAGLRRDAAPA